MSDDPATPIRAIKGFDSNLRCRDFQFEVGQTYTHKGKVEACRSGFHAITGHPLEVFGYYTPAASRFAVVELSGATSRESGGDSKIAAEILKVGQEIGLADLATEAVKWVFDRADWSNAAASNSGTRGAASNTGDYGAASNSGYGGAASNTGKFGSAYSTGFLGKVSGIAGSALHLDRRTYAPGTDNHGEITHVWAGIVGRDGIKPDTFYTLDDNGQPVEA